MNVSRVALLTALLFTVPCSFVTASEKQAPKVVKPVNTPVENKVEKTNTEVKTVKTQVTTTEEVKVGATGKSTVVDSIKSIPGAVFGTVAGFTINPLGDKIVKPGIEWVASFEYLKDGRIAGNSETIGRVVAFLILAGVGYKAWNFFNADDIDEDDINSSDDLFSDL